MVPGDLRYTKDHEWVRIEGDEAVVGITQYAADQLGDIVFVELPDAGRALDQHATFGVVESVKAVSDLFAPVGGEVIATNDALAGAPELVNTDPYGEGWMVRVKLADPAQVGDPARPGRLRAADCRGLTDAVRPARGRRSSADARGDRHQLRRRPVRGHPGTPFARARCGSTSRSRSSTSRRDSRRSRRATGWTSRASWVRAPTATGVRRRWTRCCSAASGTRPTPRTSPRSARARSRASTSTRACSRS